MSFFGRFGRGKVRAATVPRLRTLIFETTWRCNAACTFCYNHYSLARPRAPSGMLGPEPDTGRSRRIVDRAIRGSGVREVAFSGGESTLRDDIFDLIAQARLSGASVSLLTNGRNLDRSYARDLRRVGCGLVQLTFAGPEPAAHDDLCGAGAFEANMAAFEALRSEGVKVSLTFVLTRRNLREAGRIIRFAAELGVDSLLLNRFNPGGLGLLHGEELLPSIAELRSALSDANEAAGATGIRVFSAIPIMPCLVRWEDYPKLLFARGCAAGTEDAYFTVDPWGDVRFCNHSPIVLGNVLRDDFGALIESPELRAFRNTRPAFCTPCPGWDTCRGGCRAASHQLWGRYDLEDPLLRAAIDRGEVRPKDGAIRSR